MRSQFGLNLVLSTQLTIGPVKGVKISTLAIEKFALNAIQAVLHHHHHHYHYPQINYPQIQTTEKKTFHL